MRPPRPRLRPVRRRHVGIVPALALVVAAALQKRRLAVLALAVGVPTYLAWAVLLDAAEHEWDDLTLLL